MENRGEGVKERSNKDRCSGSHTHNLGTNMDSSIGALMCPWRRKPIILKGFFLLNVCFYHRKFGVSLKRVVFICT